MIIPDINLLVYAYNADAPRHLAAKAWWEALMSGTEPVAVPWAVSLGFVRLLSSPRVVVVPYAAPELLAFVRAWLERPHVTVVAPGPRHLDLLESLMGRPGVAAALTTDAHLAALAIETQSELHTADHDFARFPGLRWRNPL